MTEGIGNPDFPENRPYWDAIEQGRLLIKRCTACTKPHYYPRAHCPFCGSAETVWEESRGDGAIYSYTVVHLGGAPTCPAYVTLDDGPTMITRIVDCDPAALAIDARVRLVVRPGPGGRSLPMFTLAT